LRIPPFYSGEVAYFETRDELGFYLGSLDFESFGRPAPPTKTLVSRIARVQGLFS